MATWTNTCEYDGQTFQAQRSTSRFCSGACRVRAMRAKRKSTGITRDAKRKAKARILRIQNEVKATIDQAIGPGISGWVLNNFTGTWPEYLRHLGDVLSDHSRSVEAAAENKAIMTIAIALRRDLTDYSLEDALRLIAPDGVVQSTPY